MSLGLYFFLFMACGFKELCLKIKCPKGKIQTNSRANKDLKIVLEKSITIGFTQKSQMKNIG